MWKMGPNGPIINKKVENDPFLTKNHDSKSDFERVSSLSQISVSP